MFVSWARRATSAVSSVDPLSTTMTSTCHPEGILTFPNDSNVGCRLAARLQVQMMIETEQSGDMIKGSQLGRAISVRVESRSILTF
jgi:hypothetical protein